MQPRQSHSFGNREDVSLQGSPDMPMLSRSASSARRLRSEDSWIEISSQPSSSSLSSIGDNDIVTTGLQVRNDPTTRDRQRRRLRENAPGRLRSPPRPRSAAGSSQDEYEESESESDRVLNSSNEDITSGLGRNTSVARGEDEDDTSTALGTGTTIDAVFTPQPNAFSHPPSSQASRSTAGTTPTPGSYFPLPDPSASVPSSTRSPPARTITQRDRKHPRAGLPQTRPAPSTSSHTPYNVVAPSHSYQPDHDAALRASLSTLLSCAAAVRGSPKRQNSETRTNTRRQAANSAQPTSFRLLTESQLHADESAAPLPLPVRRPRAATSSSSASAPMLPRQVSTSKRKARESSKDRHAKKSRGTSRPDTSMDETTISPTLMTWMISAGVVLIFSAISFSAGYAFGKEVGRIESATGVTGDGMSCGRDAMRSGGGLRRLRWSTASTGVKV